MNLLVPVDMSEASEKVVEAARRMATGREAKVYVLHVAAPDPDFVGFQTASPAVRLAVAQEFRREHRAVQAIADKLRSEGIDATALLVRGVTVDSILHEAEAMNADTIVIGTHGHGAVHGAIVGSVSSGVIRKSKVPVLVVPTH